MSFKVVAAESLLPEGAVPVPAGVPQKGNLAKEPVDWRNLPPVGFDSPASRAMESLINGLRRQGLIRENGS